MTHDPVFQAFLQSTSCEVAQIRIDSDILNLIADPSSGDPPASFHGLLTQVEHFVRTPSGIEVSAAPIAFSIHLPPDYLKSVAPNLQFRVVQMHTEIVHPNVRQALVCLGSRFHPGRRLRALCETIYGIFSGRVYATESPLDLDARDFFLRSPDRVRALRSASLWRRPVAVRVRVEPRAAEEGRS